MKRMLGLVTITTSVALGATVGWIIAGYILLVRNMDDAEDYWEDEQ